MKAYEYLVERVAEYSLTSTHLTSKGLEGWELTSVTKILIRSWAGDGTAHYTDESQIMCIFMREVSD